MKESRGEVPSTAQYFSFAPVSLSNKFSQHRIHSIFNLRFTLSPFSIYDSAKACSFDNDNKSFNGPRGAASRKQQSKHQLFMGKRSFSYWFFFNFFFFNFSSFLSSISFCVSFFILEDRNQGGMRNDCEFCCWQFPRKPSRWIACDVWADTN